jgi:CelD/BcsL family acetyltransferase involved in cellulose biosynthesis
VDHALFPHTHLIRLIFGSFESVELKLEILYGIKGLESVQDAWRDLTCSVSALSLGQIVDYYLAYAFAFEVQDRDLLIATVKDADERIIAIVPLCQSKKKLLGLEINYLQFPDIPVPIRDVVIDPSGSADEILNFLFWSLDKAIDSHWDYFHFREVLAGSALLPHEGTSLENRRLVHRIGHSHMLDVSGSDYLANVLSSNARNNLRRNQKKMGELGTFEFRTISEFPDLEVAYEHFLTTEAAGWKSITGGKRAIKLHADQTRFYYDLMKRLAATGGCHIHLLYLNDEPIASDYCIVSGDKSFSVKHGYDEAYSMIAPGNLLRAYTIEYYEKSESINSIDLISGWEWQRRWRPERRGVFDIKVFNRNLRGALLYYLVKIKKNRNKNKNAS